MTDPTTRNAMLVPLPVAVWEKVPHGSPVRDMDGDYSSFVRIVDKKRRGVLFRNRRGGDCTNYSLDEIGIDLTASLGPTVIARLIAEHAGLDVSRGVTWRRVESVDGDESWFEVAANGQRWRHPVQPEDEDVRITLAAVARHLFGVSDV